MREKHDETGVGAMIEVGAQREWEQRVMKFTRSVVDMECECFCESKSKWLDCGDSGGLIRIQVTVELA